MDGRTKVFGLPTERTFYFDERKAYGWIRDQWRRGRKVYYKVGDSNVLHLIESLTLVKFQLFASSENNLISLVGNRLISKDASGKPIAQWKWIKRKTVPKKHFISRDCIHSKKSWILYRLAHGTLYCYPTSSVSPFYIKNLFLNKNGIYSLNEDESVQVYLNGFFIYYVDEQGNLDCHKNW